MTRIFTRKQFSSYLGENRAIDDIITKWVYTPPQIITENLWTFFDAAVPSSWEYNPSVLKYMWVPVSGVTSQSLGVLYGYNSPDYYPNEYTGGIYLDGTNQYLRSGGYDNTIIPNTSDWSLQFWFNATSSTDYQRLYADLTDAFDIAMGSYSASVNKLQFYSPASSWVDLASYFDKNTPYCLTATYTSSNKALRFYKNDALTATYIFGATGLTPNAEVNIVGADSSGTSNLEMFIHKVRSYSSVLSLADIQYNFDVEKSQYGY